MMAILVLFGTLAVAVAAVVIYVIMIYNGLVRMKNQIDKSFSNIDVLLKQRFDEIPKLVSVCEGYMKHERETLEAIIKARSMLSTPMKPEEQLAAQDGLSQALRSLFAVAENYPELKANTSFIQLQVRISELEDQIADRRELYNDTVTLYNTGLEQFPDVLVARAFAFTPRVLWKIDDPGHRADVTISFNR